MSEKSLLACDGCRQMCWLCECPNGDVGKRMAPLKAEIARLREIISNLLADEDMADHGWSCDVCPRAKLVKSRKQECNFSDCAENFINSKLEAGND